MREEIQSLAEKAGYPIEFNDDGWVRAFDKGRWSLFSPPEIMRISLISMIDPDHPEATPYRPGTADKHGI